MNEREALVGHQPPGFHLRLVLGLSDDAGLGAEGLDLSFRDDAVREVARLAVQVNSQTENIGARRLATLMERLLEEVSFEAPDMNGVTLEVDAGYVNRALADVVEDRDLSRYVL